MDPKTVKKLEKKLTEAMAGVIGRLGVKRLPMLPSHRTLEMMAKAAVLRSTRRLRRIVGLRTD